MIVLLRGPTDTYDITSLFSFESIRAETSLVNSFLYMQDEVFLYTEAISLRIRSSSVPSGKGGQHSGRVGRKTEETKREKTPNCHVAITVCFDR